jgi:methionyl aminopeptidase
MPIHLKSPTDIEKMRVSGQVVARVHALMAMMIQPGVTTAELDRAARELIEDAGGTPSFLNYHGFPGSICASVGPEVVHGIPGERALEEGEIISVDVGAYVDGFHGDAAVTYPVGAIEPELHSLIEASVRAFEAGLEAARPGKRVGDISAAIESAIEADGFGIVLHYGGHGIGRKMHEDPSVPNYGEPGTGAKLQPGMTLAVEPMLTAGSPETIELEDGWTVVTEDGKAAAHYEHTILITQEGAEILTRLPD